MMSAPEDSDRGRITRILGDLRGGNAQAQGQLLELVYGEMRRIAARHLRLERAGHSLQPTALVHEAYLRLFGQATLDCEDHSHFYAVASQTMRRVLVDHARKRRAAKRGGLLAHISIEGLHLSSAESCQNVIALDEALTRLAAWDERLCRVIELRFFAGLTEEEVAQVLGIGVRTVKRDWVAARAWLNSQLGDSDIGIAASCV
jgi:RNA polymerase sigma factor (TIGR02999 family)